MTRHELRDLRGFKRYTPDDIEPDDDDDDDDDEALWEEYQEYLYQSYRDSEYD